MMRAQGRAARAGAAFAFGVPIGGLAGLIGLGGGEFRLPVLVAILGFTPRAAVPMNLVVSLVTLAASLVTRAGTLSLGPVIPHLPEVAGLAAGGVLGAAWSARLLIRFSDHRLEGALALLLVVIGLLLVIEAFLPSLGGSGLVPDDAAWRSVSGLLLGIAIGAVAALLGVAGGELLIPTLMFVFGVDIYVAGTAALIISLLMVCVGLWRYHGFGALPDADALVATALPMGMGSILGAILGGILAGVFPALVLKLSLGFILIAAAVGTFGRRQ